MHRWTVTESAETPKAEGRGEDRLVVRHDREELALLAVLDGATDKSGRTYGGHTGGALAADTAVHTLTGIPITTEPADLVTALTTGLAGMRTTWGITPDDVLAPSAVAAVFLPAQRRIVRVGDVHLALRTGDTWDQRPAQKAIDTITANARAAYLSMLRLSGVPVDQLSADDVGRKVILPLLEQQNILANRDDHSLAFGVLDGRPVPARHIEVIEIGPAVTEIVIASDGYLSAAATLHEAEEQLRTSLAEDPLRIGRFPATKGVAPGAAGFDDRTYVRIATR